MKSYLFLGNGMNSLLLAGHIVFYSLGLPTVERHGNLVSHVSKGTWSLKRVSSIAHNWLTDHNPIVTLKYTHKYINTLLPCFSCYCVRLFSCFYLRENKPQITTTMVRENTPHTLVPHKKYSRHEKGQISWSMNTSVRTFYSYISNFFYQFTLRKAIMSLRHRDLL